MRPGSNAPPGDVHQDYAHGETPEAYMHMANYYRVHTRQFAQLIGHFDAVPEGGGTGQSHLFVSAMHTMGMPDDSFGQTTGTALDGSAIDMTGPLPRL